MKRTLLSLLLGLLLTGCGGDSADTTVEPIADAVTTAADTSQSEGLSEDVAVADGDDASPSLDKDVITSVVDAGVEVADASADVASDEEISEPPADVIAQGDVSSPDDGVAIEEDVSFSWPEGLHGEVPGAALPAPEFVATSHDGTARGLEDLMGKPTVMWFFPFAGTPG